MIITVEDGGGGTDLTYSTNRIHGRMLNFFGIAKELETKGGVAANVAEVDSDLSDARLVSTNEVPRVSILDLQCSIVPLKRANCTRNRQEQCDGWLLDWPCSHHAREIENDRRSRFSVLRVVILL